MGQPIIGASVSLRSPECHGVGALLAARSDGKPATIPTIIKKWPPSRRNGGRLRLGMVAAFASEWVAGFARNPHLMAVGQEETPHKGKGLGAGEVLPQGPQPGVDLHGTTEKPGWV